MSLKNQGGIINIGTYNDNSREYNIDARGRNLADVLRDCDADDVTPDKEWSAASEREDKNTPVTKSLKATDLPFLDTDELTKLELYTLEEFAKMYHAAARGKAKDFADFIKRYRDLGILRIGGIKKTTLFAELKAYFGNEISYGYTNFIYYF